jgi:hypothetical protein
VTKAIPDLFAAAPANTSLEYQRLCDPPSDQCARARAHCEDIWRDFAELADDHFVAEFPVRPHERWFEMYLTIALLRAGYSIECPKPGPDVLVKLDGRRIWIEATCANPGQEGLPDTVPERPAAGAAWRVPHDLLALRVCNALSAKVAKFQEYVASGLVADGDAMAVAINVHAVPYAFENMEAIMLRALYGVGSPTITIDRDTRQIVGRDHEQLIEIRKASGRLVDIAALVNGCAPRVSAVIGSRANVVNLPHRLGDDFISHPSPVATTLWAPSTIQLGSEWMVVGENANEGWAVERIKHMRTGA